MCIQIVDLDASTASVSEQLASLEHSAYQWQLKIFDSQVDIFTEEELRVRSAIDNIKHQISGLLLIYDYSFQCFDTVGWATGRASGL